MPSFLHQSSSTSPETDAFLELIEAVDWAATSIGPIELWPESLLLLLQIIIPDPQPHLLFLGHDQTMLYNQAYAELVGERHPSALGNPVRIAFPETYQMVLGILDETTSTGRAHVTQDYHFPLVRHGFLLEVHMSWIAVAFPPTSSIYGCSIIVHDKSEKKILERRSETSKILTQKLSEATDLGSLWSSTLDGLSERGHDCPFAILYAPNSILEDDDEPVFQLRGTLGEFPDLSSLPETLNLNGTDDNGLAEKFRLAMDSAEPVFLKLDDCTLPELWSTASCARGWNDACSEAVILPIQSNKFHKVRALLVLGLSTRVPYSVSCASWIDEIRRTIGNTLNSIRRREAAARELAKKEREAHEMSFQYRRLVKMMELSDVGIFECDCEGNLLQANDSWHRLASFPQKKLPTPAFSWLENVHELDKELVMSNWHNMLAGKSVTYQMRWKHPERPEGRWILAVCLPMLDDKGNIVSISGCTTDIDAQKRVEKDALQALESERRFLRFTQSSPVAIHIMELPSKAISYCNDAWFEMLDIAPVPYAQLDASWTNGIFEDDLPLVKDAVQMILATHEPQITQFRFRKMWVSGDGHRYQCWGASTSHVELNDDGTVKAIMTTTTDISHLKWAEDVQKSRVEEAVEAKKQQEIFVDITSHELRNPMSAVVHCADAIDEALTEMKPTLDRMQLLDDQSAKKLQGLVTTSLEAVSTIASCSAHQKRIVDDLLTISKLDSNMLEIQESPVGAASILNDMQRVFEIEAERAGISLQLQADPSISDMGISTIMLDTGRVHQILINLITNSIKFTRNRAKRAVIITMGASVKRPSDGVLHPSIDFVFPHTLSDTVREAKSTPAGPNTFYLWFTVSDTGRGIEAEDKLKLFSRFQQGSPRTYSKYGGSGLGLFISRELAELQGGEIGVATEPGHGSTFAFFVKTHSAPPPETTITSHRSELVMRSRSGSAQTNFSHETAQIHVLVAEDNLVNQKVLKRQLTNKGYHVWTADNGQEALEFLKQTRYWRRPKSTPDTHQATSEPSQHETKALHVILMDTEMPVMDGLTAAKRIREMQKQGQLSGHVPILSVSANARPEQTSMAIAAGMDDSISKPFRVADLLPKIDRLADLAYFG